MLLLLQAQKGPVRLSQRDRASRGPESTLKRVIQKSRLFQIPGYIPASVISEIELMVDEKYARWRKPERAKIKQSRALE